jgi:2-polyprenyl-3-methyl-5-hydroxy-6-metoxy-1,4-benzoquinol methylase
MKRTPREKQYQKNLDDHEVQGPVELGLMASHLWRTDPRHLAFTLARYKHVAKLLHGKKSALEIGCGDGFASGIVQQEVSQVHGLDFDPHFVESAQKTWEGNDAFHFFVEDMLSDSLQPQRKYEAIYSLDVIEHITPDQEDSFLRNARKFLQPDGVAIIGSPTLESQEYASKWSKEGHVNCKSGYQLKTLLEKYFKQVFLLGMNDETLHTGYSKMVHYNLVICIS